MRVLFCLTSLGAGGTERSTALLLPELRDRGIDCQVAVLERSDRGDEQQVRAQGFEVVHLGGSTRIAKARALRKLVAQRRPDVLHTAIFDADLVGRVAGWRSGCAVISSLINTSYAAERLHDSRLSPFKIRLARAADGWTARHLTHALHAVSDGVARANADHLRLPLEKIIVVERGRNPLEPSATATRESVRTALGIQHDVPLLLAVGRVEFQKAHIDLVRAVGRLRRAPGFERAEALVAGREGNASTDVEHERRRLGLENAVHLLGHRDDVADLLLASDVFVLPSKYEGTAGAAIEAMASSVPIVASRVAGLEGVLESHRNALLTPVGDVGALVDAVRVVFDNSSIRKALVACAQRDFTDRFTLARCADRMNEMYVAVCNGHARAGDRP